MNWPWNRDSTPPEPDEPEEEYAEDNDEEPEAEADPLAALDEPAQQRVQALAADYAREQQEAMRAAMRERGFDFAADGSVAVTDVSRAQAAFGMHPAAPQAPPPIAPVLSAEPEMPDPYSEPAAFRSWQDQQIQRQVDERLEKALAPLKQEAQSLRQTTRLQGVQAALPLVAEVIAQQLPWLPKEMLADPEFEVVMTQALLSQQDESVWRDRSQLAMLAGAAAGSYATERQRQAGAPASVTPPRGAGGRFVPPTETRQRSALNRAALTSAAPSRDSGRQGRQAEILEIHRRAAELTGKSPEEMEALARDPSGEAAEPFRQKRLQALKDGRR